MDCLRLCLYCDTLFCVGTFTDTITGVFNMIRMSRAGRKALMLGALQKHDRRYKGGCLTTAQLAHNAGLMSSTNVVNMLRELVAEDKIREVQTEPTYGAGYTVRAWQMVTWKQMSLPDRYILINGEKVKMEVSSAEV